MFTYTDFDDDGDPNKFETLVYLSPFSTPTTGDWSVELAEMLDFESQTQYILDKL